MAQLNIFNRKVFFKDLVVAIIIVALPFLFYLYLLVPDVKVWETQHFTFTSNYFNNVRIFAWTIVTKLFTLMILSLWFITCKHWWRYSILIPIIIEGFKLVETLNDDIQIFDEYEFINSLPFTIPFILLVLYISSRLNYYYLTKDFEENLDNEINSLILDLWTTNSEDFRIKRNKFEALKREKINLEKKEYLMRLVALKNSIIKN